MSPPTHTWITTDGVCFGTKEIEPCNCGGDESKCNFYPEKRKMAMKPEFGKWISVEERLPEKSGKYIVCTRKMSVYCTTFKLFKTGSGTFQTDINTHVTHWMPMPEPPKEGA